MKQVDQIKAKSPDQLTHADVKLMIASGEHQWLSQLPESIAFDYNQLQLPRLSVEAWNDDPLVLETLAILEWYAAAYTRNEKKEVIANVDCLAVLDKLYGDRIYTREGNGVIAVALLFDMYNAARNQRVFYQKDNGDVISAIVAMAYDVWLKSGNVFLDDRLTDDEIKLTLETMGLLCVSLYHFDYGAERAYLDALLATPISNDMSERIARLGRASVNPKSESLRRPSRMIGEAFYLRLRDLLDDKEHHQEAAHLLSAKLQSDQPYALFELMLPALVLNDLYLERLVEGGRLYGFFDALLYRLRVEPVECAYAPYRRYLRDEFNARLAADKFGVYGYYASFEEKAHDLSFFMTHHAELQAENLPSFNQALSGMRRFFLDEEKKADEACEAYKAYAYALTLPGLPAEQHDALHARFNTSEGIQCMIDLIYRYYNLEENSNAQVKEVASLRRILITPNFPCDQTYGVKLKENVSKDEVKDMASRAKPVMLSLVESKQAIAQALFDKITLGGGCFLLNALMTNSKVTEVRYDTNTMKTFIPLMRALTPSPEALSVLMQRKENLSLRDALMMLMFVRDNSGQSKAARLAAFDCLNNRIGKADLKVLADAMVFVSDEAKSYLVGHLYHEGEAEKCHQQLLSNLGLKPSFVKNALTMYAQATVDSKAAEAQQKAEAAQGAIYGL